MTDTQVAVAFVEVRNTGKSELRLALNSRVMIVKPGATVIADREAATNLLGNWELRDHPTDALRKARSKEYQRVRGLFGCLPGGTYEEKFMSDRGWSTRPMDVEKVWAERRPHAEVKVNGEPVVLVIDDPEGKTMPAEDAGGLDRDALIAHILRQQEQMSELVARLEAEQRAGAESVQIPEDSPDLSPARRRKPHQVIPVDDRDD